MSARKRRLVLTPLASDDLRDILLYTGRVWGREQRDRYRGLIFRRLRRLIDYPELGPPRDEVFPGCRSLVVEQHVAYYRVMETEIVVSRLLHARQDPTGVVPDPADDEPPR
jgi:toxin ParE1/3/4